MLDVFLCHSPADREIAEEIAARLERAEVKAWLEQSGPGDDESVAAIWEGGLSSAAILLLLSPEAVPARRSRATWRHVLEHLERSAEPALGSVLVRDCAYPAMLERNRFFRWGDDALQAARGIERWVMSLHAAPEQPMFVPARLPWFEGRESEIELLRERLVDQADAAVLAGQPGSGKTALAQEFARQASAQFRDILWVGYGDRSLPSIAGDLAAQLGMAGDGPAEEVYARVAGAIREHRLLVIFDDPGKDLEELSPAGGRASVLITATEEPRLSFPVHTIRLHPGSYSAPVRPPAGRRNLRLWQAMSVCRPQGFALELAAEIAGADPRAGRASCDQLIEQRLADPFDEAGMYLRLSTASRAAAQASADVQAERRRHAEVLHAAFSGRSKDPERCGRWIAEVRSALRWAMAADWKLAVELAQRSFQFLRARRRTAEAFEILLWLSDAAEARQDQEVLESCEWELSWIRDAGGPVRPAAVGGRQMSFEF